MQKEVIPSGKVVSADGPNEDEKIHEPLLREWLTTTIEPEEESSRRRTVLERINALVRTWIHHTMISEFRLPESTAKQVSARIFATGSYRYNVHTSGSDIDIVLIAPYRITREHFFNSLAPRLKSEPWVKDLHCIQDTRVPIIAMVCDGIDIDLSFGSIRKDSVPEVITDDLLVGLDEQSVLSCNAVRVAHNIMTLVPDSSTFRQTLRFVKAWGKRRGIYSNTFGFPSGIGWAILVAFVSQCYPHQNVAGLVTRFFRTYHTWFKPNPRELGTENRAIYLTASMRAKTQLGRCWDPRESKSDAMALFPVLTPALPYGNACFNVTSTNLKQLCEEFKRGQEITSKYLSLAPSTAQSKFGRYGIWSKLLEDVKFFGEYSHYMHIQIECTDPELFQAYVDGVESKIRVLWAGNAASRGRTLEDIRQLKLRLNPRRYEHPEEAERRAQLLKKRAAANNSLPQSTRNSTTRESGNLSQRHSTTFGAANAANSLPPPSANAPTPTGPFLSTAHYFIGMAVDTSISTDPIDLSPSISTFHQVVRQLRQYKEGVTTLPKISVCTITGIPEFVLSAAGYVPPTPTTSTAAAADSASAEAEAKNKNESSSSIATGERGGKRERDEGNRTEGTGPAPRAPPPYAGDSRMGDGVRSAGAEAGPSHAAAPGSAAAKHDPPNNTPAVTKLEAEELDLEEALGFDF